MKDYKFYNNKMIQLKLMQVNNYNKYNKNKNYNFN